MNSDDVIHTLQTPRPLSEWSEADGNVLWWVFPVSEPPYVGTPLDCGRAMEIQVRGVAQPIRLSFDVEGWPGYHTHWTPIIIPSTPATDKEPSDGRHG